MSARNRISRRDMSELAQDLFGLGLATGTVDAICQRASDALQEPHERLSASVLGAPALNVDETGWQTAGEGRSLWTATTPQAAIFRVATDRHRDRLAELIGTDYGGIVCSDRWWAYDHLDPECRQACWEHYADLRVMPTRVGESFGGGWIRRFLVGIISALRGRRGARLAAGSGLAWRPGAWSLPALAL